MDEDWGSAPSGPTFSLFRKLSPQEEARKDTFVDIVVYNRWSKAERRLYQKLKAKYILEKIEEDKCNSIDDISNCLNQLNLFMKEDTKGDQEICELIGTLENMKLRVNALENSETKVLSIKR